MNKTLISRKKLFDNPNKSSTTISPDGKLLAWLAPVDNVLNIWVAPIKAINEAKCITQDKKRGIRIYKWSMCSTRILFEKDNDGDENWQIHSINPTTCESINLTDIKGVNARIALMSTYTPSQILVELNDRDAKWHDVYKIDIKTATKELLFLNDAEFEKLYYDHNYSLKLATKVDQDSSIKTIFKRTTDSWEELSKIPHEDQLTTYIGTLKKDGNSFYIFDSRNKDKTALYEFNYNTNESKLLAESDKADVSDYLLDPNTFELEAWACEYLKLKWTSFSKNVEEDLKLLEKEFDSAYRITSRSQDNNLWIIASFSSLSPTSTWLYNRKEQDLQKLYSNSPLLDEYKFMPMNCLTITSRDKIDLPTYITIPDSYSKEAIITPEKPLPMVLLVHGGPWARDVYSFNRYHQWLANRGYVVMSVNYRGSEGFGKNFINLADNEWSKKMHDDLIDCVDWAIKEKIADKDKVAIMGGSYGGYATLVGLTFTPDVFCCGVDVVGPSNLVTLLQTIPPYWKSFYSQLQNRVGDPETKEGLQQLKDASPLNKAAEIKKPLLIGQGANDPRVKKDEADQIVNAMKQNKLPVIYILYPDEGHGWARPENNMSFNAVTEKFLQQHLGGRCENIGDDFEGSSIQFIEGENLVEL